MFHDGKSEDWQHFSWGEKWNSCSRSSHSLVCRRVVTSLRGACSRLPTQKGGPDTQNQRIRPYFLGPKCRFRYSASIGLVHVPKLGLRSPTKPEGGGGVRHDATTRHDDDETHFPQPPQMAISAAPQRAPHAR